MSRWTYLTEKVSVGSNSQEVRQLTAGERKQFAETSKQIGKGEVSSSELPSLVVKFGAINPTLSQEDVDSMPPDLMDACVSKILELSGLKNKGAVAGEPDEKKEPTASSTGSN